MEFMSDLTGSEAAAQPSLFELFAQDKLSGLFKPALSYVLATYAQRYPRYLLRLVNRQDELYALLMLLVDRHYLRRYGSSFAENIYGLKRVSTDPLRSSSKLNSRDITRSLCFLVVVPYLKGKLDLLYEKHSGGAVALLFGDQWQTPLKERLRTWIKRLFVMIYPYVHAVFHLLPLGYNLAYLLGKTRYYSPWLQYMGIEVQRMTMADYVRIMDIFQQPGLSTAQRLRLLASHISEIPLDLLNVVLPMSVFFFRFLEWWYTSDFYKSSLSIPVPLPPKSLKPSSKGTPLPDDPRQCPICHNVRTNPAIIPDSGYACCYPCLHNYVEQYGHCPVTLVPATSNAITKLYSNP
ncbi:Pex12 amino terminal region-domain-containing protein [Dimargaris cristalligena]|uniref:Peroxisome assembly protein 12 n=1 Tax=Dimargaris cristalligena TaxID=215637 RepID=A0A4Q0A0Z5_9FUNG|nr:Pex12 amino terminal region-domain-containing protein [Dimargaris cristalligena]|eukprot:RKP38952.1 Pex12 amino terminal region-domain-containing protein [Dimargaris cristalligena]